jgi:ubiquinone/menaquinone biosynthesis C-methylase UbiE
LFAAWVGSTGEVVGTDIDDDLLAAAGRMMREEGLERIALRRDDLFASRLEPGSFDLVHARFQLAPLGRAEEQLAAYATVVRPGGWLVLEEPDAASWRVNPSGPATDRLITLILQAFEAAGGDFSCGRRLPDLLARSV